MRIIGGKYKGRALLAPKSSAVRPTSSRLRETLFNICQNSITEALFLDLFAGTGAMGIEALSREAKRVTFVENNPKALLVIKKNIASFGLSQSTTLLSTDVFIALNRLHKEEQSFDLVYADPPYNKNLGDQIVHFFDTHRMLNQKGRLFIEDSSVTAHPEHLIYEHSRRKVGEATLVEYHTL